MNVLIVYSHPSKQSYTAQILEDLKAELLQRTITVEVSDLYAMDFQPILTEAEYNREAKGQPAPLPEDIVLEHQKINRADCIIFLYPVWWCDCPAILKGWFDRVYTVGFAYKQKDASLKMKTMRYGFAVCTAGYTNEDLTAMGVAQSMQTVMLDDRMGQRFEHKEMVILGGTLALENTRAQHVELIRELANKIGI
jgi:NAD(P)H dehydrogenase (quinone)